MADISLVIITGNSWRHRYFANRLIEKFNVIGLVSETKKALFKTGDEVRIGIVEAHERARAQKEEKYFAADKEFSLGKENILSVPWGGSNTPEVYDWIVKKNPTHLVLFGSSIIKDPLLGHFGDRVINLHLGLSPYYRGVATNFWPLVFNEPECVGATVHLATLKVDGGAVLGQSRPDWKPEDGCHDASCKSLISGTDLMINCLEAYANGRIKPQALPALEGKLFKSTDLTPEAIIKMQDNLSGGMIRDFLKNKEDRLEKFPIIQNQ